jgi:polyvinyl alcohol dehydrogenase (cytochrome)
MSLRRLASVGSFVYAFSIVAIGLAIGCSKDIAPPASTVPVTAGTGTSVAPNTMTTANPTQGTNATAGSAAPVGMQGQTPGTAAQGTAGVGSTPIGPDSTIAGTGAPTAQAGTGAPAQAGTGAPTATPGVSEWKMIAYDETGSYNNIAETKLTKDNAASLTIAWQIDLGTNVYGAPLQIGDKVYASAGSGVKALDPETGKQIWANPSGTSGSLAYDNGTLYLYTARGSIIAIDAMSGMQKWSKSPKGNPGGDGSSSPVIAGNMLFIGGSNGGAEIIGGRFRGFLAAMDKASGDGIWTSFTVPEGASGASLWNSAAIDLAGGQAFAATGNNHGPPGTDSSDSLIGMDLMTGDIKWKNQRTMGDTWNGSAGTTDASPPDADFGASPVFYQVMVGGQMTKVVSAGQKIGAAHAVKAADGMLLWTRQVCMGQNSRDGKFGIFVNSAWSGKNMLFACNSAGKSTLAGLDGATGDVAWMTPLDGEVYGRISVANGVGFAGVGKSLVVFDTDTGKILKTVPSKGGTVAGTITIANGRVAYGEGLTWANGVAGRTLTMLKLP